jgi:hypothetical protein
VVPSRDREISPSIAEVMVDIIERSYVSKGKVIGSGTIDVMELLKRLVGSQDWCVRAQRGRLGPRDHWPSDCPRSICPVGIDA